MTPTPRHRRTIGTLLVAAVALVACGGDDDDRSADASPRTPAVADTTTVAPATDSSLVPTSMEPTPAAPNTTPTTAAPPPAPSAPSTGEPLRMATTPGWEWLIEPLLDGAGNRPAIDLDLDWQEAHAGSDIEQKLIEAVAAGDLDLGYVGARAFDGLPMSALTAPLLIDSHPLQQAVLESDLPERLLPALDELGVTGLAVGAGPLRRPIAVDRPLLRPADYQGIAVHTTRSSINQTTVSTLGGVHTDVWGEERNEGLRNGSIDATENSLDWAQGNPWATHITANVVLWPAIGVLIVSPETAISIGEDGLDGLRDGVAAFRSPDELAATDQAGMTPLCHVGFRFAQASDEDVSALREALEPVYVSLAEDPTTNEIISEIESMKDSVSAAPLEIPADCSGAVAAEVDCRPVSFLSGGRDLPGERCDPTGSTEPSRRPAAVILGGCGGYEGDLILKRGLARSLAANGVVALIVDYHAAAPAPPDTYCQPSPETLAAVPAMLSAVTDATAWLRADPTVDGAAVGAVGYSLGGLFAAYAHLGDVDLASVPTASFRAIAMFASPMLPDAVAAARAGRLPPLYLLHGELDEIVSVDDSTQLAQAARVGGSDVALVVVPAMDHGWSEPYASAERADGIADVTEFISTQLGVAD